jgi:hypothetical protein
MLEAADHQQARGHRGTLRTRLRLSRGRASRFVRCTATAVALFTMSTTPASACPDCSIGKVARAQFWSDRFAENLMITLAPFVVMVVAAVWAERVTDGAKGRQRHE